MLVNYIQMQGRLIERRRLKEGGIYSQTVTSSIKLICFQQKYQEGLKVAEYPLLGHVEIHIALSNSNVRILAQGYCVAIVSLYSLWTWQWTRWGTQSLVNQAIVNKFLCRITFAAWLVTCLSITSELNIILHCIL